MILLALYEINKNYIINFLLFELLSLITIIIIWNKQLFIKILL